MIEPAIAAIPGRLTRLLRFRLYGFCVPPLHIGATAVWIGFTLRCRAFHERRLILRLNKSGIAGVPQRIGDYIRGVFIFCRVFGKFPRLCLIMPGDGLADGFRCFVWRAPILL